MIENNFQKITRGWDISTPLPVSSFCSFFFRPRPAICVQAPKRFTPENIISIFFIWGSWTGYKGNYLMCSIAPTTIVVEKRQATYCWAWCPCGWSPSCARCQQHKPAPRCRTWWVGVHIQSVQWGFQYYWFRFHLAILSTNYQHLTVLSTNYWQII